MNVLVFGGESPRHAEWVQEVRHALSPKFDDVHLLSYKHWTTGEKEINLDYEVGQAGQLATNLEDYMVVAKSIGTIVAALAIGRGLLHPERCILLGFPLSRATEEVAEALNKMPPTIFVQNEFDKVASGASIHNYLDEVEPPEYSLKVISGNATHDYVDYDLIAQLAFKA